jgi:hypothetical protein
LDIMVVDMVHEDKKMAKSHMTNIDNGEFLNNRKAGVHPQYMINTLQRNNGNGTFSELSRLAGVAKTGWSWGPLFADFDNDGFKDIFITNGVIRNNLHSDLASIYEQKLDSLRGIAQRNNMDPKKLIDVFDFVELASLDKQANYIYKNNGDYSFSQKINEWGLDLPTTSNGSAYADFDLDGDLDLIINNLNDKAMLYKNNSSEKAIGNYIRFKLVPMENQSIYGAKVTVYRNDSLWQVYHVTNTRGFRSKSEDIVHIGIGGETRIDKVDIEWQNGTNTILENVAINQLHIVQQSDAKQSEKESGTYKELLFNEITEQIGLDHVFHIENDFDDFSREGLLPYEMSHLGPCIGVGDINGDGMEDFYIGGSSGISGSLYIQKKPGRFVQIKDGPWTKDKRCEDMDVAIIDVDNDNDLDMIVVSGGNEFKADDTALFDRLYINNGQGVFIKNDDGLPKNFTSASCIRPCDYDKDGDLDVFIGGRLIPGKYPQPANSHLLENVDGRFIDVTVEKAAGLGNLGLVTDACWTDYNKDGFVDLAIVGEWMPITIFNQPAKGRFENKAINGLNNTEGWYYTVVANDLDEDGDDDLVVGNLGLNYSYTASEENPLEIFSYDFDRNGRLDIVLAYHENGLLYPYHGRDRSVKQMPALAKEFDTYEKFSKATLDEIYGESLKEAYNLKAKTFASAYVENIGEDGFRICPLPSLAQASSINNILIKDYDMDGNKDILVSGNLYQSAIEIPGNDAGTGLFMKGNGKGAFIPIPIVESGLFVPLDSKDMKTIKVGDKEIILVVNNSNKLQAIEYKPVVKNF